MVSGEFYRICGSKPNKSLAKKVKNIELPSQAIFSLKILLEISN